MPMLWGGVLLHTPSARSRPSVISHAEIDPSASRRAVSTHRRTPHTVIGRRLAAGGLGACDDAEIGSQPEVATMLGSGGPDAPAESDVLN